MTPLVASVMYLGLGLVLVSLTVAAWSPRVFGPFAPFAGMSGMLASYFIPQTLVVGGLVAALFWRLGAFDHPAGLMGLVLHAGAWAGLGVHLHLVWRALPVLDGATVRDEDHPFTSGLTADEQRLLMPGRVSWRPSFTLRTAAMEHVRVTRGVLYRQVGGAKLRLDVYHPPEGFPPRPAILYVHGGGWMMGTRRQSRFLLYELASAGFPCFAISYRFAPFAALEDVIEDCKFAAAWAREHAREHGGDGRVVVMGGSAGGHLAALLALSPNEPRFQPGFEDRDTRMDGAVIFYGVADPAGTFTQKGEWAIGLYLERLVLRRRFSLDPASFHHVAPMTWVSSAAPPTLLVHGTSDAIVPIAQSQRLAQKLRSVGAKTVHLLEVPLAHHAFEVFPTPLHQRAVRVVVRFVESLARG